MSKALYFLGGAFIGVVAGGAASWLFAKKKFEKQRDEEVESYKRAFQKNIMAKNEKLKADAEKARKLDSIVKEAKTQVHEIVDSHTMTDYENIIKNYETGTDYVSKKQKHDYTAHFSNDTESDDTEAMDDSDIDANDPYRPYEISDEEFFNDEETTKIELYLFNDGMLVDESWEPVEEIEKVVPKKIMDEFLANSDKDELFLKSDGRNCLYDVQKQDENWEGFVDRHPIIKETIY